VVQTTQLIDADRLVQGDYTEQKLINEETYSHIEGLEDLAPLCRDRRISQGDG
jgi:acetate kinase